MKEGKDWGKMPLSLHHSPSISDFMREQVTLLHEGLLRKLKGTFGKMVCVPILIELSSALLRNWNNGILGFHSTSLKNIRR